MATKQFGPTIPPDEAPAPPLAAGTLLGARYLLEERVAQGGMGAIYRGRDQLLDRRVAIKVVLEGCEQLAGYAERFEREARAASRVSHPNCIVVHDFGRSDSGLYLVQEWVDGAPLSGEVQQHGPLSAQRAIGIIRQVCSGLAAVHAAGVVHRDVKPENIMLVRGEGGAEVVKLIDFGIARLATAEGPALTRVGTSMGSPRYMAPEQALGEDCDGRVDVYATGGVLFFMLTGRTPYTGESAAAVLKQHIVAPPPSVLAARPGEGGLAELDAVVKRAMAKAKDERLPTMAAFLAALEPVPSAGRPEPPAPVAPVAPTEAATRVGVPVPGAHPAPAALPAAPEPVRRRGLARVGLVAAALAVGGLALALLVPRAARYPELEALLTQQRYQEARDRARALLAASPGDAALGVLHGHALAGLDEADEAAAAYVAAIAGDASLAGDERLQQNALSWLGAGEPAAAALWQHTIGKAGLPALRAASSEPRYRLRWDAIRIREALGDREGIDYFAAWLKDVEHPPDCSTLKGSAQRLAELGDRRAVPALRRAKDSMNFIDELCVGSAIDDALVRLAPP